MKRIMIVGAGGTGKSTLARALAYRTGLPLIHMDREFWRPRWEATPKPEWIEKVRFMAAGESWIIDGNYGGTMDMRMERADTVIFLDFPRWRCFWGIVRRRLQFHGRQRPDMADGLQEHVRWDFVKYLWNYPARSRPIVLARIDRFRVGRRVEILRNPTDVSRFLGTVG